MARSPASLPQLKSLALLTALIFSAAAQATAADITIRLAVAPGLKYDPARFAVAPGDHVTVVFHNGDDMIHNFVVVQPGERLKVVQAALTLGADGPARNFIPDLPEILASSRALNPTETAKITFIAPAQEGVYPYVCTFPGHGFVMFGAMYVTTAGESSLPPLASDRNVPPEIAAAASGRPAGPGIGLLTVTDRPLVSRTFLHDCGPASIAVGLPGGQSYVFDTDTCSIRYVWKGGFVDNTDQWLGKGDLWSKVVGRIYYRARESDPRNQGLHSPAEPAASDSRGSGSRKAFVELDGLQLPAAASPRLRWLGYRLIGGYPQFHYTLNGADVRELVQPASSGLKLSFEIAGAPRDLLYVTDPDGGAAFTSSAGMWENGTLRLSAADARQFAITLTERPKIEPLGYWSMNDVFWSSNRIDPKPGVVGRAFAPGGEGRSPKILDTGISAAQLADGATLMGWVKSDRAYVEAKSLPAAHPLFSFGPTWVIPLPSTDGVWHHVAMVFAGRDAPGELWLDGVDHGPTALRLPAVSVGPAPTLAIGSVGKSFLAGLIDEVRIFDRALPPAEIQKTYRREAIIGGVIQP